MDENDFTDWDNEDAKGGNAEGWKKTEQKSAEKIMKRCW